MFSIKMIHLKFFDCSTTFSHTKRLSFLDPTFQFEMFLFSPLSSIQVNFEHFVVRTDCNAFGFRFLYLIMLACAMQTKYSSTKSSLNFHK